MVAAHIIAICKKYRRVQGPCLTKLTIFTVLSKASFKLSVIPLAARASRWMLQCAQVALGATACMHVTSPLCLHVMAFEPSVQIPTHLDHQSPFDVTKLSSKDPPLFCQFSPKLPYPNLICIFLVPFEREHFEVCGNVKGM